MPEKIRDKRIFNILFAVYFILISCRSIEAIKAVSNITPLFSLLFIYLFYPYIFERPRLRVLVLLANAFGLWALITALWSSYHMVSALRGVLFLITANGVILGAFHYGKVNNDKPLFYLAPLNIALILMGFFSLITHIPSDYWTGSGFGLRSFLGHQNTLGSLIVFTLPAYFLTRKPVKKEILIFPIFLFLNLIILLLTHSRASIAVLIIGVIFYALLVPAKKLVIVIAILFAAFIVYSYVNAGFYKSISTYFMKAEGHLLQRKQYTMAASVDAAKEGAIFGIGYGISTPKIILDPHYEDNRLIREKTISILALVEETGIIGLLLFLSFIAAVLYSLVKNWNGRFYLKFFFAVIIAMAVHAQFEAWWVGVFTAQLSIFLAVLGTSLSEIPLRDNPR